MKYFIDTAEQTEINKWANFVDGVTSNPSILSKAKLSAYEFFTNNRSMFDNIFIQITSVDDVKKIVDEDTEYKDQMILKVPLLKTPEFDGYALLKDLSTRWRTAATIVYDINQFNFACEVGADFSIVLYAKNENHNLINECYELQNKKGFKTKTIAASFRTADHVFECIKAGADYATVPPKVMVELFRNPQVLVDYNKFYEDK